MKNNTPERQRRPSRSAGTMRTAREPQKEPVRRARRTRRKGISMKVYATIMVLLTVAVAVTLCLTVFFNIDKIEIIGETRYSQDEIIATSGLHEGDNLLLADLGSAKERLERALPFIERAELRRRLPTGLEISLTEATPIFSIRTSEQYLLLSTGGKVLALQERMQPGTILVTGAALEKPGLPGLMYERESNAMAALWRLYDAFEAEGMLGELRSIELGNPLSILLTYGQNVTIDIGTSAQLPDKLTVLRAVLDSKIEPGKKVTLHVTATQATIKYED